MGRPKETVYFNEYKKNLLEKRKQEEMKEDVINELNMKRGHGLTSPTTVKTTEETRLLMEYIDRENLFNISRQDEGRGKILKFRKFFKSKRYQQVEIYAKCGKELLYKEGKVSAVGRDFVMLTNLKERVWIPYSTIDSANIPYGIPNYSNSHQHYIFDNNLRNKLITQFGDTVARRDILKQQFFEESLQTNLDSWKETWVAVRLDEQTKKVGKISKSDNKQLILTFFKEREEIDLPKVKYIEMLRFTSIVTHIMKRLQR